MSKIKVAIVGVGNCTSSFIQGLEFYKKNNTDIGLINNKIGEYSVNDIEVVSAFDINESKVDKDLSEAIFASPNIAITCGKLGVLLSKKPFLILYPDTRLFLSNPIAVDIAVILLCCF